jgi:hypothetical protein
LVLGHNRKAPAQGGKRETFERLQLLTALVFPSSVNCIEYCELTRSPKNPMRIASIATVARLA